MRLLMSSTGISGPSSGPGDRPDRDQHLSPQIRIDYKYVQGPYCFTDLNVHAARAKLVKPIWTRCASLGYATSNRNEVDDASD